MPTCQKQQSPSYNVAGQESTSGKSFISIEKSIGLKILPWGFTVFQIFDL